MTKESDYELDKMERLYINECTTNAGLQHVEAERIHWWRLACGRLGILYDIIKIQPHNIDTQEEYHAWLEDFILDAIEKLDEIVAKEKNDDQATSKESRTKIPGTKERSRSDQSRDGTRRIRPEAGR